MKYYPKLKLYKASNVTFDPVNCLALSYGWWEFVKKINNQVIFNGYSYSNSTSRHQSKVRSLLRELNIPIDIYIESPNGLQNLGAAICYYGDKILKLDNLIAKGKKAKNVERIAEIERLRLKIKEVELLIKQQPINHITKILYT